MSSYRTPGAGELVERGLRLGAGSLRLGATRSALLFAVIQMVLVLFFGVGGGVHEISVAPVNTPSNPSRDCLRTFREP